MIEGEEAPNTFLIPISFVRGWAVKEANPNSPSAATINARVVKMLRIELRGIDSKRRQNVYLEQEKSLFYC